MGALSLSAKLARVERVGPGGAGPGGVGPGVGPGGVSPGGLGGPGRVMPPQRSPSLFADRGGAEAPSAEAARATPASLRVMLEALAAKHAERAKQQRMATLATAAEALAHARTPRAWARSEPEDGLRVIRHALEPDHHHGRVSVEPGLAADPAFVAELALDPALADIDPRRVLYLDTETTGLSLGGGTVPFLVGLAYEEGGAMIVEQLFLDSLAGEGALLERLRERVAQASALVTYNGKSFDWPLLTTRFVLHRVAPPPPRPHLDLLGLARRVYRARLGSVRLVHMEAEVLGYRRERDIDGAEIPGTYWAFQRHGHPEAVWPVLEHNVQDVIALAALQGELVARYREVRVEDDPTDQWSRAKVAFRARSFERAIDFAQAALDGGATPTVAGRAALLLAEAHRKAGRYGEAAQALEDCLVDLEPGSLEMAQVRLALAKLWEHRLKDPSRALYHAQATERAEGGAASERRQARLNKRINKSREATAREA